jgi:hypothetical protein
MVDLVMLQVVRDLVAIFGVIAGFTYYVLTVRNSQRNQQMQLETRQAQLFMQVYTQWRDPDRLRLLAKSYQMEWDDYYDFQKKYGVENMEERLPYSYLSYFYEGVGVLIEEGLIDIELVAKLMAGDVKGYWDRFGPFILDHRRIGNYPDYFFHVEYLYRELENLKGGEWGADMQLGHEVNKTNG